MWEGLNFRRHKQYLVANYQRFTETEHNLRINQREIGDLVEKLPAGIHHENTIYV